MHLTTSAADFSKETLVVKEEETYDTGVFEKVEAEVISKNLFASFQGASAFRVTRVAGKPGHRELREKDSLNRAEGCRASSRRIRNRIQILSGQQHA